MARKCDICGRQAQNGNSIARRGAPKRTGGAGRKITGITHRKFQLNLQKVRAVIDGTPQRIKVCTRCLRSGKVTKG
jgi:large subunit ribosomal protein L28